MMRKSGNRYHAELFEGIGEIVPEVLNVDERLYM